MRPRSPERPALGVPHLLRIGETLDVGDQAYEIVHVEAAAGGERAWGAMVPR